MTDIELISLINKGESSKIQFKIRVNDAYKIGTEFVAFSNTKGGLLIIGVDDKTGEINGMSYSEIQKTNEILANSASENVKPPIYIYTETVEINDSNIVIAKIKEGNSKPHTDNKGIIWVKNGSDKRKVVSRDEMARLLQSSGNMFADETIVNGSYLEDIDSLFLRKFIKKKHGKSIDSLGITENKYLENMGMLKGTSISLAALLLFGNNPQKYRPTFTIQCISFVGNSISTSNYRDKEEPFEGNLAEIYTNTLSFITRNLRKIQNGSSFNSSASLEIPIETFEELLVNALIHRDYFINTSIKVFIFDNRIEIISPGKLPNTLSVENIKLGTSIPRNPILFSNARHILPFVGVGSGIPRALEMTPDLELINDTERELFIAVVRRNNKY